MAKLCNRLATLFCLCTILCVNGQSDDEWPRVGPFQLQLHWTPESCWQGDCSYQEWCLQCEGYRCNVGDILWLEPCRHDRPMEQLFFWKPIIHSSTTAGEDTTSSLGQITFGLLQVQSLEVASITERPGRMSFRTNHYLCLERVDLRLYKLQNCQENRPQQWFRGLQAAADGGATDEAFELHPPPWINESPDPTTSSTDNKCLNTHHHPRKFEELLHTSCADAQRSKTNLWQAVYNDWSPVGVLFRASEYYQLGNPRENPRCGPKESTCGLCQGHCVTDMDCAGSLKCFERDRSNPVEPPPGCFGRGVARIDYCYALEGN